MPYQWSSLLILLLLNTVERQSITSEIRHLGFSNIGFPSGLRFVVRQESSVNKSFMVMNQSNTTVPMKDVVDLRCKDLCGEKKRNTDKTIYTVYLNIAWKKVLVCIPCAFGVGIHLLWSKREANGPQQVNENKPKEKSFFSFYSPVQKQLSP